ncbi:MAG: phosphoribosylformylglycinamidine synthase subunit PurQ [Pseudomonadota bacterium]
MKSAVIVSPASNCDRDAQVALRQVTGQDPHMVWHADTELPDVDLIVIPGGFSYGDYLRAGAMAARSPVIKEVVARAEAGIPTLGICNGFQILTEAGLLPGALLRNAGIEFVCGMRTLRVESTDSPFTKGLEKDQYLRFPVAHHDGNFTADDETLNRIEGEGRVAFRYVEDVNGSARNIAGVLNDKGNVLGMMPHPERVISPLLGGEDGVTFFKGILEAVG